jgi:hypothetical protein
MIAVYLWHYLTHINQKFCHLNELCRLFARPHDVSNALDAFEMVVDPIVAEGEEQNPW